MSSPKHVIDFTYAGNGALTGIWEAVPGPGTMPVRLRRTMPHARVRLTDSDGVRFQPKPIHLVRACFPGGLFLAFAKDRRDLVGERQRVIGALI
ncbi:MAG: hypothetical protein OXC72_00265 [Roseovarius sp.]|nr:hypothetical protein [Roseovarius sp.]